MHARRREAFYNAQCALLRAVPEVSSALYAHDVAVAKAELRRRQLKALAEAVELAKGLSRYMSSNNDVDALTSEQSLLTARLDGVNDRLQQRRTEVNLDRGAGLH